MVLWNISSVSLSSVLYFFLIILIFYYVWVRIRSHWTYTIIRAAWSVPGPKTIPILNNTLEYRGTPAEVFQTMRRLARCYPKIYRIWLVNRLSINIHNADDMELVLANTKLITKAYIYSFITPWLHTGLLTSGGEKWKSRRKLLTPAFHFNILKEFVNIFENHSVQIVNTLSEINEEEETNVVNYVTEFALHTLSETTMGYKVDANSSSLKKYKEAIHKYGYLMTVRLFRPWFHLDLIFFLTRFGNQMIETLRTLHKFTAQIIKDRLQTWNETDLKSVETASGKQRHAMLDLLIMQMKDGENIDFSGIHEEVDTFMFEGHDTTSMAISFFLLLLANHPEVQEKIYEELHTIFTEKHKRKATYDDLQAMTYLEMCIKESLRLYPPVPFISRLVTEETKISTCTLTPGMSIHMHIYDLHRDPNLWPNPDKFDPERFSQENSYNRHPFAYIPFSAGSRNCIGQRFAMLEIKSFVSNLLWEYQLKPVDTPETLVINADLILRPRDGIRVKFVKRN